MSKRLMLIIMVGAFMCLPLTSAWAIYRVPTDVSYYDPAKAYNGYTEFTLAGGKLTYLIDMYGRVVRKWDRGLISPTSLDFHGAQMFNA